MISDNFWKILFILMVLTGLVFWYKDHTEQVTFKRTATELADLIAFTEETLPRNEEEAHQRFIKAITLVNDAEEAGIDTGLLVDKAFDYNELSNDGAQANLIRNAIFDSQNSGKKLGIFNEDALWDLRDGQAVEVMKGPYKGEKIAICQRVHSSIGEGA